MNETMTQKKPYQKSRRLFIGLTGIILIPIMVTSCALPEELKEENIVNQFFPNFWVFLAHIIALVILLVAMIYFLWKPTQKNLKSRQALIQKNMDEATEAYAQAKVYLENANAKRLKASMEANQIIAHATSEGFRIKAEIEDAAKRSANITIQNAKQELVRRERVLREEMQKQIINVALTASEALTKKSLSSADNQAFIEDFIKALEEVDLD